MWQWWWILGPTAVTAVVFCILLRRHVNKTYGGFQLAIQTTGIGLASKLVEAAYNQIDDGLQSIEAVLTDNFGHNISVEIMKPSLVASTSVGDFIRLSIPRCHQDQSYRVTSARIVVHMAGHDYVMRFSNSQLNLILSTVMASVREITLEPSIENRTLDGLPTRVTLRWVHNGGSIQVTEAVGAMAGPKGRWWTLDDTHPAIITVTGRHIMSEILHHLYGIKSGAALSLMNHLMEYEVDMRFSGGSQIKITRRNLDDPILPPTSTPIH